MEYKASSMHQAHSPSEEKRLEAKATTVNTKLHILKEIIKKIKYTLSPKIILISDILIYQNPNITLL